MQKQLAELLNGEKGTYGVAIKHVEKNEEFILNGEKLFQMASVFKIPILATLFKDLEANKLSLSDRVELNESDRVPGSGVLKELNEGAELTVEDLATLMIIISDNMATDKLLKILGIEKVNNYMKELGFENMFIRHSCWDLLSLCVGVDCEPYSKATYDNVTSLLKQGKFDKKSSVYMETTDNSVSSVIDLNLLLEKILLHQGISKSSSTQMINILSKQQSKKRIPHQLPPNTKIAHKTGTLGGTVNDSGIIYLPNASGTLLVTVLSKENNTVDDGERIISNIAKIAFDYYKN